MELVRELEKVCLASELRRPMRAGDTEHGALVREQQRTYAKFGMCGVSQLLPDLSRETAAPRTGEAAPCGEGDSLDLSRNSMSACWDSELAGALAAPEERPSEARTEVGAHGVGTEGQLAGGAETVASTVVWLQAVEVASAGASGAAGGELAPGVAWLQLNAAAPPPTFLGGLDKGAPGLGAEEERADGSVPMAADEAAQEVAAELGDAAAWLRAVEERADSSAPRAPGEAEQKVAAEVEDAAAGLRAVGVEAGSAEASGASGEELTAGVAWLRLAAAAPQPELVESVESVGESTPENNDEVKPSIAPAPAPALMPSSRAPSFKSKQPAALELGQIKAEARDWSLEQSALGEQLGPLSESMQLSVTADEDSLALSATPGDPSSSFCKPSQEDARQPHDADPAESPQEQARSHAQEREQGAQAAAATAAGPARPERAGAPVGVPPLALHLAVAAAAADAHDSIADAAGAAAGVPVGMSADGQHRPMSASNRASHARARPQSATISSRAASRDSEAATASAVQRSGSHPGVVLRSVLEGGHLSPVPDTSMTEPCGLESDLAEVSGLAPVQHSSVCISDGSVGSDEDVLACPDLDDEDDAAHCGRWQEAEAEAPPGRRLTPSTESLPGHAEPGPGAGGREGLDETAGENAGGSDGIDETAEEKGRRMREQVDSSVHKEMVQQYNQFEKIGSSLSLVAEDEQEEQEADHEHDDDLGSAAAGTASAEGHDGAQEMTEPSWERREIDGTPRGELDMRAARGDKPTRPDDRVTRRAARPADVALGGVGR